MLWLETFNLMRGVQFKGNDIAIFETGLNQAENILLAASWSSSNFFYLIVHNPQYFFFSLLRQTAERDYREG